MVLEKTGKSSEVVIHHLTFREKWLSEHQGANLWASGIIPHDGKKGNPPPISSGEYLACLLFNDPQLL